MRRSVLAAAWCFALRIMAAEYPRTSWRPFSRDSNRSMLPTHARNCSRLHILAASPVSDGPLCKRMKANCAGGHHGPEFLHLPKSSIPQWQAEYQAALLELDPTTSLRAGYSSGNRYLQSASIFRTTQTLMLSGRPSKMLCPASAFSRGTNLDFLTGKRSKNHAAAG